MVADHYVQYREDGYVNFYIWSDKEKRAKAPKIPRPAVGFGGTRD